MKRRIFKILTFCLLFILGGYLNINGVSASSVDIEITTDENQVTVGEKVYVYINFDSGNMFEDIEANLVYDENILEYKNGASFITGNSGFLKISDINISEGSESRKYALEFEAIKVGKCEIEFSGSIMVYDYDSKDPMSVFSNSLELEVIAAQTASDNGNLASLKISPSELTPAFDKNILEYNTSVNHDIERLIVVALPEDDKSTVRVVGNELLKEGDNKIVISVSAESGKVIEYNINVIRDNAPEENEDTSPIIADNKHGSFELVRSVEDIFAIYGGKYKIVQPSDSVVIPNGYTRSKIIISGISIEVFSSEQLDSEFLLIYAENELGVAGFYSYDKIEKTMQRYVAKSPYAVESVDNAKDILDSKEYSSRLNKSAIIIALLGGFCALFAVLAIRFYMKSRGYKEDDI